MLQLETMTESEGASKVSNTDLSTYKDPSEWYRDRTGTAKNSLRTELPDAS